MSHDVTIAYRLAASTVRAIVWDSENHPPMSVLLNAGAALAWADTGTGSAETKTLIHALHGAAFRAGYVKAADDFGARVLATLEDVTRRTP